MSRVLVTGGGGFIGSFLCERLVEAGHHVTCLDNFFTGSRANVAGLTGHGRFELVEHDVVEPLEGEFDRIFNLACPASPVHYQFDAVKTLKTSVLGTLHALELAHRTGARLLQASTSEVYGDPELSPQSETYWGHVNPVGTRSCYDEGKRAAETLITDYGRQHGVETRIVRIFNTYGPRMHPEDGRVVSNFVLQALRGQPLTIYGDGSQTRAFCFVSDLVEGLLRMMDCPDFRGPVNLGNPGEFTIAKLAEMVKAMTGSKSAIEFLPAREDDPIQRNPDITLAKDKLDWSPQVALEDGLRRTIDYFAQTLAEAGPG